MPLVPPAMTDTAKPSAHSTEDRISERNGERIESALAAFTTASKRVEDHYNHLENEVRRLSEDLEAKNRELRKKMLERERMQAMLISTLQSLTCGVMAVGRDGVVVAANPVLCEIFDCPIEKIAGLQVLEVLSSIPERGMLIESLLDQDRDPYSIEWTVEENGHRRQTILLSAIGAAKPYDQHLAGLIIAEDITELRRLEHQALVHSRLSGMGELAMRMAHEIRNPLGSISLYATTLAHELESDPSLGALAEQLVAGISRLDHVVTGALEFARPRRLAITQVNLTQVLMDALQFIEHPRLQKNIEIDLQFTARDGSREEPEALIPGDAEQLVQVFLNIALNAIQAMGEDQTLTVILRPFGPDGWEVQIADTGVGIAVEDRDKIFDPFYTTKDKGSGIGLAVVHRILAAHGATIDIDSQPGAGARFSVVFTPHPILSED